VGAAGRPKITLCLPAERSEAKQTAVLAKRSPLSVRPNRPFEAELR
jgi:hypothetical protein